MAYWLIKSEPGTWSWDEHVKKGADAWTGVRNHQAKAHLNAMKKGDRAFFYHSGEGKEVVGVSEVVREAYPDVTDKSGAWRVKATTEIDKFNTVIGTGFRDDSHDTIGGMLLSPICSLLVVPVFARLFMGGAPKAEAPSADEAQPSAA
mgnify:CR=1 FL=1